MIKRNDFQLSVHKKWCTYIHDLNKAATDIINTQTIRFSTSNYSTQKKKRYYSGTNTHTHNSKTNNTLRCFLSTCVAHEISQIYIYIYHSRSVSSATTDVLNLSRTSVTIEKSDLDPGLGIS